MNKNINNKIKNAETRTRYLYESLPCENSYSKLKFLYVFSVFFLNKHVSTYMKKIQRNKVRYLMFSRKTKNGSKFYTDNKLTKF